MNTANQRSSLVAALQELAQSTNRTKKARLSEIFDDVQAALAAGTTQKQVIAALEKHGLTFTLRSFETTYARIKNERRKRSNETERTPNESVVYTPRHLEITPTFGQGPRSAETGFRRVAEELAERQSSGDPRRNE